MVPASFRFTDGVELSNPLRAISTHLPISPTTPRSNASARILAGGRSVAEGMSARVAQTIALGSQFVDQRVLTPIVRGAALSETLAAGFSVSDELAKSTLLSNAEPPDAMNPMVGEDLARLSLLDSSQDASHNPLAPDHGEGQWVNAPQDPYENLLDEVDQLLGEIKDDDDASISTVKPTATAIASDIDDISDFEADIAHGSSSGNTKPDLDLRIDDDDDSDIAQLLKD
ncbi:hypothetical protein GGF42_006395 [Coemansia sp. RSA 2424]|nr:hypothetical protein GGF42_006395 [Coemansia sp. RSA 2424]